MASVAWIINFQARAQLSPGPLAAVHSHLEGMSNCTQCHTLGSKVSNEKCLACHSEIKSRVDQKKGYHSSQDISEKECISCHSDHHGLNFQMIRFEKDKFNHSLTGYVLTGSHAGRDCSACHKTEYISDQAVKNKKFTYMGLNAACLSCHADYHQKTLPPNCSDCHGMDAFKPAPKFNHASAKFQLNGKHRMVECIKCHRVTEKDGKKFQVFSGVSFIHCTDCHSDPHHDQFGQNCAECHTVESFLSIKQMSKFDHSKTNFPLEDKHLFVSCKSCHPSNVTRPVKHDRCTDCHADYHAGQFVEAGRMMDCSSCHNIRGFDNTLYTIDRHNSSSFKLEGAHEAVPCIACHKKEDKWSFRNIGMRCSDCHQDIHSSYIDKKYYPESECRSCHSVEAWDEVRFNHDLTGFALTGAHETQNCRACHFKPGNSGEEIQQFRGMSSQCKQCHKDIHNGQFAVNDSTECIRCHSTSQWAISQFNHNNTDFKLDGKHENLACVECHKPVTEGDHTYILYKVKDYRCEACHL